MKSPLRLPAAALCAVLPAALCTPALAQKWTASIPENHLHSGIISYGPNGTATFAEALDELLAKHVKPDLVSLSTLWCRDDKLQSELLEILERTAPETLGPALKSAATCTIRE